jgi:hypothetical protein
MANGFLVRLARPVTQTVFMSDPEACLTETSLLVLDGDVGAGGALVLAAEEVADLLVLGLLDGGLVALVSGAHELLLDEVNTYVEC